MVRYNSVWNSIDSGREGLWQPPLWEGVLRIISEHEGDDVYNPNSNIYKELNYRYPNEKWVSTDKGKFRPLFRDYPNAWTKTEVLSLDNHKFTVTDRGKDFIRGNISKDIIFTRFFTNYFEDDCYPFRVILAAFLIYQKTISFEQVYYGIMQGYRLGDSDLESQLKRVDTTIPLKSSTPTRRLKLMLGLLEQFSLLKQVEKNNWEIENIRTAIDIIGFDPRVQEYSVLVPFQEAPLDGDDTSCDDFEIFEPYDPTKIRIDSKTPELDALIKRIRRNEIDLAPSFQRKGGIWNEQNQSRLIESLLIKIPLPAFYMDATDDDKWLVVDGLQRLTAIKRFTIDEDLKLTRLEFLKDYENYCFSDLPRNLQRRIEETEIVVYQILPGTPERVKFDIFKRINTGGLPLSSQEIRHALFQGQATDLLLELAESDLFTKATDNGVSPKRMDDKECALRFMAFTLFPPDEYKYNDFDGFLINAMKCINQLSKYECNKLKNDFYRSLDISIKIFGNKAFRKIYDISAPRPPINKSLFEAWVVAFNQLSDESVELLIDRKDDLLEIFIEEMQSNKDFEAAISQGTGSKNKVKIRFSVVEKLIEEVLE